MKYVLFKSLYLVLGVPMYVCWRWGNDAKRMGLRWLWLALHGIVWALAVVPIVSILRAVTDSLGAVAGALAGLAVCLTVGLYALILRFRPNSPHEGGV